MGRHRFTNYEIREVSPAYAPAVARREPEDDPNGRVIVEVDASLRGPDREEAIRVALEPYRRGWRDFAPVPLLAGFAHEHPRVAAAVAGAGAAAAIGVATLTVTSELEPPARPHAVATVVSSPRSVVRVSPGLPTPSPVAATWATNPARPTGTQPPGSRERPLLPDPTASPTLEAGHPASTQESATGPLGTAGEKTSTGPGQQPRPATTPAGGTGGQPTQAPPTSSAPDPKPSPSGAGPKVEVEVDVKDREVGVGVGDTGVTVDVDELEVEVGDDVKVDVGDGKIGVGDSVDVDLKEGKAGVGDLEVDLGKVGDRLT
jgi:hypothetical protein